MKAGLSPIIIFGVSLAVALVTISAQTAMAQMPVMNFTKLDKAIEKAKNAFDNLNKTVTVADCIKTRQMYPTTHNLTVFGMSFNPLDIQLKACKEAGK